MSRPGSTGCWRRLRRTAAGHNQSVVLVLAGDIGGTNSRFALFQDAHRTPLAEQTYPPARFGMRQGRLSPLMARVPAYVVINPSLGLLGASALAGET